MQVQSTNYSRIPWQAHIAQARARKYLRELYLELIVASAPKKGARARKFHLYCPTPTQSREQLAFCATAAARLPSPRAPRSTSKAREESRCLVPIHHSYTDGFRAGKLASAICVCLSESARYLVRNNLRLIIGSKEVLPGEDKKESNFNCHNKLIS